MHMRRYSRGRHRREFRRGGEDTALFVASKYHGHPEIFHRFFSGTREAVCHHAGCHFFEGRHGRVPVVLAGWFYRIPIVIHDSDAKPGLTNVASSFFAKRIFMSFDAAAKYFNPALTSRTGVPVRRALFANPTTKELAKETLGFDPAKPLLLVLGGSQGAERINNFILANLTAILKETQVLHQTGLANFAEVKRLSDAALLEASFVNRYERHGLS